MFTKHPPKDILIDYCAGKLEKTERAHIERHVASCAACRNDVKDLGAAEEALSAARVRQPDPEYFYSIVPRVRSRLEGGARRQRTVDGFTTRILLPLAASIICIFILVTLPSTSSDRRSQVEELRQVTKGWTYNEIADAVASQQMPLALFSNRTGEDVIVGQQLLEDRFVRSAMLEQIAGGEYAETNFEDVLSLLDKEQVEWLLANYQERETL